MAYVPYLVVVAGIHSLVTIASYVGMGMYTKERKCNPSDTKLITEPIYPS